MPNHSSRYRYTWTTHSRQRKNSRRQFHRQLHIEMLEGRRLLTVGYPELISLNRTGTATANNYSASEVQSLSADGKYQVFASDATDLVANDINGQRDVFLRNLETGGITLISRTSTGETANGWSREPVISTDGNYVAYASYATNLNVTGVNATNGAIQIYRWNRLTGQTVLVSQNGVGSDGANNNSNLPTISGDGSRIAYTSLATDLVSGVADANGDQDIFLRDFRSSTPTSILVSRSVDPNKTSNGRAFNPKISDDGSRIVYQSSATDIEVGVTDANSGWDTVVFHIASQSNAIVTLETSTITSGNGYSYKRLKSVSADGRYQVFSSSSSDLVQGDTNQSQDLFLRDLVTGTTTLISRSAGGVGASGGSDDGVISADGNYVAFRSYATNLDVTGVNSSNGYYQIYRWHRPTGQINLISVNTTGTDGGNGFSREPSISGDGSRVVFLTNATDLVSGVTDSSSTSDVYLRNFSSGTATTTLVSRAASDPNATAAGDSLYPEISRDGSRIVYASSASNIDSNTFDTNSSGWDLVVFDIASSTNEFVSVQTEQPTTGNRGSARTDHSLSADGRFEVFESWASDLTTNDGNLNSDVFLKDHQTGSVTLISRNALGFAANSASNDGVISADGNYVAFRSYATNLDVTGVNSSNGWSQIYRWHRLTGQINLVSVNDTGTDGASGNTYEPSISGDGARVAFVAFATDLVSGVTGSNNTGDVYIRDFTTPTPTTLFATGSASNPMVESNGWNRKVRISRDGSRVFFLSSANDLVSGVADGNGQADDLYAYEISTGTKFVVNQVPGGTSTGNAGVLEQYDLSDNGAIVVFSSSASDLHPSDINATYDIFALNLSIPFSGVELISVDNSSVPANGSATAPSISGNGSLVAFETSSSLDSRDTNGYTDIYVRNRIAGTTHLISLNSTSTSGGNNYSISPQISANGAVVAFASYATDLDGSVGGSLSQQNVFIRSWQVASPQTYMVSKSASGTSGGNGMSLQPLLNDAGTRLVFTSNATDLVSGFADVNGPADDLFWHNGSTNFLVSSKAAASFTGSDGIPIWSGDFWGLSHDGKTIAYVTSSPGTVADDVSGVQVYVRDMTNVANAFNERISVDDSGNAGAGWSFDNRLSLSGNGRYIAFSTSAILDPLDTGGNFDVYVRDRVAKDTTLISVNSGGAAGANNYSIGPVISSDGSVIAFQSYASDLDAAVTDSNNLPDVFIRSWKASSPSTRMATRRATAAESPDGSSHSPELSDNGGRLVYSTTATNLLASIPDVNGTYDDLFAFDGSSNQLVSVKGPGKFTGYASSFYGYIDISANGLQIVFSNSSPGLVPFYVSGGAQVYLRDYASNPNGLTELISFDATGKPGNGGSYNPAISGDGSFVAFESNANLALIDSNSGSDVYVRDRRASKTVLISANSSGTNGGNNSSYNARINREGTTVVWQSFASDLDANVTDTNDRVDVFYRKWTAPDAKTDTLSRAASGVSTSNEQSSTPILSAYGTTAVFASTGSNLTSLPDTNGSEDIFFVRAAAIHLQAVTPPIFEEDTTTSSYTFKIHRSWLTTSDFTVQWRVLPFGSNPANAADFGGAFPTGTVSFATGEVEKTFHVLVSGDMDVELDEMFAVQLFDSTNNSQILTSQATATIRNNDIDLVIEASQTGAVEGNSGSKPYQFTVKRLGYLGIATDVSWAVSGQTASPANAADFGGTFPSGNVSFAIGETEKTFSFNVTGDSLVERDEVFAVTLSNPSPNAEILVGSVSNTITNDDSANIALVGVSASESAAQLNFTVTISNPVDTAVSVNFSTLATGTALSGTDFTSITNQAVTFPAGSTGTQTVSVTVANENLVELNETVNAKVDALAAAGRDVSIGTANATGTITNDDSASIALVGVSASESTGQLNFTVTISNPVDTAVSVNFSTLATGTALSGTDFTSITNQAVNFSAGSTTTQTVTVTVLDDLWVEPDETVNAQVSELAASGRDVAISTTNAVGTILNDDAVKVVNSKVYYKGSFFDTSVDAALDPNKVLAKSGATSQVLAFANLINTVKGINGLVFDIAGLAASSLTASDFVFRMSPTGSFDEAANPPNSWAAAPAPTLIHVTAGTATAPARVRIEWADNAIANRWLQIKILANTNTGLATPQVYYLGHLQGETNGSFESGGFLVRTTDITAVSSAVGQVVGVGSVLDLNKDGRIRTTDISATSSRIGQRLTRITIPAEGSGGEGEGAAGLSIVAAPGIDAPQQRDNSDAIRHLEIRARLTDEVFHAPLPASDEPVAPLTSPTLDSVLNTQSAPGAIAAMHLPSLDEYFERLGRGKSQPATRAKRA